MVIVDTSVWIDFLKGAERPGVWRLEQLLEDEVDIFTTGVVVQEVLSGIKSRRQRNEVRRDFGAFLLIMPSLDTHVRAAEVYDGCRKKGFTIRSGIDCLIASLAMEHDLSLLATDRDYRAIAKAFPLKLDQAIGG